MKKYLISTFMFLLIIVLAACGASNNSSTEDDSSEMVTPSGESDIEEADDVIEWDFSLWGGSRENTTPVEDWAEDMYEMTDGRWKITLHYGEALSDSDDNLKGITNGLFEAAHVDPFYTPGVLPMTEVLDLPFISPIDSEELSLFLSAAWEHPAIQEEMEENNAVPLLPSLPPQYQYSGTKELKTVEDFDGLRVAGMSAYQGQLLEEFGAVPNPMPAPEIYTALERGTLDGVIFPYTNGHIAWGFDEVTEYTTDNLDIGSPGSFFIANKDAFEDLPEDIQDIHNEYIEDWHEKSAAPFYEADEENLPLLKENLEYTEFPEEEREKLEEAAEDIWDEWVEKYEDRGPSQEVLDYMLDKRKEISGF